jgi:hypothetical protein
MTDRATQIGFSQRVRLEWLQRTAHLVLAGNDRVAIDGALQDYLHDKLSIGGTAQRGNREKAITILLKIWVTVPADLEPLRDAGLDLLRRLPREDEIAVHWGMTMAAYPFWGAVATTVGRLLRLQGTATAAHVQRRVREQYGERDTVSRAARRVLRAFADWGVLAETSEKGVYQQGLSQTISDLGLIAWLVEASLHAGPNASAPLRALLDTSTLFPFRLAQVSAPQLAASSTRIEVIRHGFEDDIVVLKQQAAMK